MFESVRAQRGWGRGLQAGTSPSGPTVPGGGEQSRAGCSEQGVPWAYLQSSPGQGLSLNMALKPWAETPDEVSLQSFLRHVAGLIKA